MSTDNNERIMAEIRKEVVMLQETIEDMKKKGIDQQARTKSAVGWIRIEGAKEPTEIGDGTTGGTTEDDAS